MKTFDIKCPVCTKRYLETTDKYDPDVKANGAMVRLKDPWSKWHWSPFGDGLSAKSSCRESRKYYAMFCPGCGGALCPSGKLKVVLKPQEAVKAELQKNAPVLDLYSDKDLEAEWNERLQAKVIVPRETPEEDEIEARNNKIFALKKKGLSNTKIGEQVGLTSMSVGRILKKGE